VNDAVRTIHIAAALLDALVDHARREAPNECCGMLVGRPGEVDSSVPTRNIAATPATRYEIDPREHIALNRELRGSGREVVGVYHSHPQGPGRPSASDVSEAFYPEFVYVIVSLENPLHAEILAFAIKDGHASEVTMTEDSTLRSFRSS
jgi:proteasome lid subunit RPN8/RPN11